MYTKDGHSSETIGSKGKSRYISRYNEKGLLVESLEYKDGKLAVRQENRYAYDTAGNWIKRYNYYNGQSPSLTEREITYY